jgi:uncharacterized protein (DUF849 family)
MLLQAALNGPLTKDDHPALPLSVEEVAADAAACVAAGATSVHLHPRDSAGNEQASAEVVDVAVRRVHASCGVEVSVTTGAGSSPSSIGVWS